MKANTIGLDDDGQDVEIVVKLEATFSIGISDPEAAACRTVGDVYELLRRKLQDEVEGGRCATAMAFYRLRQVLRERGFRGRLEPATPLAALSSVPTRALFRHMQRSTGLRAPDPRLTWMGRIGVMLIMAGWLAIFPALGVSPQFWLLALGSFAAGWLLVRHDPRRMPADCPTLGGLARRVAALNFGRLRAQGARARDRDLWDALVEILMRWSMVPRSEITPETRLLYYDGPAPAVRR